MTGVPRGTEARLHRLVALVEAEQQRQNLVSATSLASIWTRHIEDSRQLLALAPPSGSWLDIGSGAGFPGMVIAIHDRHYVTLCEPRRLRAEFLRRAVDELSLDASVRIVARKVEQLRAPPFAIISARAVMSLDKLFAVAAHLADAATLWLLPKGRTAADELAVAQRTWQGGFELRPSITDPAASIVVARRVERRADP